MTELTAADVIARLGLKPHPEGGHYRETFRDTRSDAAGRAASTAIYFLLARGERSHQWSGFDIRTCLAAGSGRECQIHNSTSNSYFTVIL